MNFKIPENHKIIFEQLSNLAGTENKEIYIIGGYVRDIILDRVSNDIDIVVTEDSLSFAEKFRNKYLPKIKVNYFKNFGTAQIKVNELEIQFVTARTESYLEFSRNPTVKIGTIEDDQKRRDFTINCLALNLNPNKFLAFLDPFNGLNDLYYKIIKTPLDPYKTFSDDPLRILRAIRFACQLNFNIDSDTWQALNVMKSRIKIISKERIVEELNKIMLSSKPSMGWNFLDQAGILENLIPELNNLKGTEYIDGIGHKNNFYHSLQVLDNIAQFSNNLWLRWAALLHDIGKAKTKKFEEKQGWTFHGHEIVGSKMVVKIFQNLKLPQNEKLDFVKKLIFLHHRPISLTKENITDSAIRRLIFDAGTELDDLMLLCKADITSKNQFKIKKFLQNFDYVIQRMKQVDDADKIRNWQPPISGELIMKTFNLKPSLKVGLIKNGIREAILDGIISNDFDSAFNFMLEFEKNLSDSL